MKASASLYGTIFYMLTYLALLLHEVLHRAALSILQNTSKGLSETLVVAWHAHSVSERRPSDRCMN